MGVEIKDTGREIRIEPLRSLHLLNSFNSGVEQMDSFIHENFKYSIENHYCVAYGAYLEDELIAVFALSFDSLDLDADDKEELMSGMSVTGTPAIDWNYKDTFYAKSRYPALDIAYLAVSEKWRGQHIGEFLIDEIAEIARTQLLAGCQFLTVEALATREYSAVGFYSHCGFTPNELRKPYKDTLRMFRTLYDTNIE